MSKYLLVVFVVIVALFTLTLAAFNMHSVTFDLYFYRADWPLFVIMLVFFATGVILSILVMSGRYLVMRSREAGLKKRVKSLEQEVQNLRNIPIKDTH